MSFVHHICIQTNEYEKSLHFYQELGFVLVKETPDFHGRSYNAWLKMADFYIELQTGKQPLSNHVNVNYTGIVHFCIWVEDLRSFIQKLPFPKSDYLTKK